MYMYRVPLPKRTWSLAEACRGLYAVVVFMLPSIYSIGFLCYPSIQNEM